jgi:uncharacterized protein YegL
MSSDPKKKKKESLQLAIERLQNSLLMASQSGNTRQVHALEKCIKRLMEDLKKLKY